MKEYHQEKKFPCSFCEKEYATQNGRHKHENTHKSKSKLICAICGHAFMFKSLYTKHLPIHDVDLQVPCSACGKLFASENTMKRHYAIHLNLQFDCPNCPKFFDTKEKLQQHSRGSHGPGYTSLCGRSTSKWPGQRQHHQKKCNDCIRIRVEKDMKTYPVLI